MTELEVPRPSSGYNRDTSPGGRSEISDSSLDEVPDATLARRAKKGSRYGVSRLLPVSLRPTRTSQTDRAFNQWKLKERRPIIRLMFLLVAAFVFIIVLIILLAYFITHLSRQIPKNDIQRIVESWGQPGTITSSLADSPTRFSRGINPIPCHSHNDYTRKVPLYDALYAGCTSVEADVWYSPRDLLVGHTITSLTEGRTLKSLYIDPLISILSRQNPASRPLTGNTTTFPLHGIFDNSPALPLTLLIDIKNDPEEIYNALQTALEPLRSRGWLTSFDSDGKGNGAITQRLITVVLTGAAPFDLLTANTTYRDTFYDAPLGDFWGESTPKEGNSNRYNATNSYYASTDFEAAVGKLWHGVMSPRQVEIVRAQVAEAQRRGLKARYWNTPGWPRSAREHVWDVLVKEGVDVLNVDDLVGVAQRKW